MLKSSLKKLVALLLAFLLPLVPFFAEDFYEISEEDLTMLETTLEQQKSLISQQKIQLEDLKIKFDNQMIQLTSLKKTLEEQKTLSTSLTEQLKTSNKMLENAKTSFQIYEREVKRKKIKIGVFTALGGIFIGGLTTTIIMMNVK